MMSSLKLVSLGRTNLTPVQLTGIFNQLSVTEDHKLRTLKLFGNDLSSVPTKMLAQAMMSGLKLVSLRATNLTPIQLTGIFNQLSVMEHHNLRSLRLPGSDLSLVPTKMLARAMTSGLKEVSLSCTNLTPVQLTERFIAQKTIVIGATKFNEFNLMFMKKPNQFGKESFYYICAKHFPSEFDSK